MQPISIFRKYFIMVVAISSIGGCIRLSCLTWLKLSIYRGLK